MSGAMRDMTPEEMRAEIFNAHQKLVAITTERDTARAEVQRLQGALERIRDDYGDVWGGSRDRWRNGPSVMVCICCGEDAATYMEIRHDDDCPVAIAAAALRPPEDAGESLRVEAGASSSGTPAKCETCNGRGVVITMGCMAPKMSRCQACRGTGEAPEPDASTPPDNPPLQPKESGRAPQGENARATEARRLLASARCPAVLDNAPTAEWEQWYADRDAWLGHVAPPGPSSRRPARLRDDAELVQHLRDVLLDFHRGPVSPHLSYEEKARQILDAVADRLTRAPTPLDTAGQPDLVGRSGGLSSGTPARCECCGAANPTKTSDDGVTLCERCLKEAFEGARR